MTDSWFRTAGGFPAPTWSAGWTTASGPDFRPATDSPEQTTAVERLTRAAGLSGAAWARQVHGSIILRAEGPGLVGEADGLWTDIPGLGVVGRSADCPLVLLGGPRADGAPAWGFAHASWRSTVLGITGRLAGILTAENVDPAAMHAWICPSAGPCCYEVGDEVRDRAIAGLGPSAERFFLPHADRWILDLWSANRDQLERAHVPAAAIGIAGECTICGRTRYPSYRREGAKASRFAAVIGARETQAGQS